jgi:hypothetical protein
VLFGRPRKFDRDRFLLIIGALAGIIMRWTSG